MPAESGQAPNRFLRRTTVWLPTWRLVVPGLLLLSSLLLLLGRSTHAFLSPRSPVDGNILVAEGWLSDPALQDALAEFHQGNYDWLVASGGPMERGSLVSGYATYADIAGATLLGLGMDATKLIVAPAQKQYRNRTFVSATSVRDALNARSIQPTGVNIVSVGPHARRTRVVYEKVLGSQCPVGILALPPLDYDPDRWWASSEGVKATLTESIGWVYEWLFDGGR